MRRIVKIGVIIILLSAFLSFSSKAYATFEHIENYNVTIHVQKSGTIDVTEKILYDFGEVEKHGIYRDIPYIYSGNGKKWRMDITDISVVDEGKNSYTYQKTNYEDSVRLKIGDADTYISGEHQYIISYAISGGLLYFSDHDELYWNAIGTDWNVPIAQSNVLVTLPKEISEKDIKTKCFVGTFGTNIEDCTINMAHNTLSYIPNRQLDAYEGITVVAGFPKGIIAELLPKEVIPFFSTFLGKITLAFIIVGVVWWYLIYPIRIVYLWFRYGRDPFVGVPVRSYFDSPQAVDGRDISPAEAGSLLDEKVHMRDIFATVVDLARRGYITIVEEKKKDFVFKYTNKPKNKKDVLIDFEEKLLSGIFSTKKEIRLKDTKIVATITNVQNLLYQKLVDDGFFLKNPQSIRNFYIGMGVLGLITGNVLVTLTAFTFGQNMPRKTKLGAEAASKGKGLLNFIKSQDRQLAFQADMQMFFEKILPFAVAFGVEKIWMERFKDIDLRQPEWFQSSHAGSFSRGYMLSSMSQSFKSFSSAATPVSSSTGHSSGFSGVSSGGGGGGGGGGSW